jgi:hypothetical protein
MHTELSDSANQQFCKLYRRSQPYSMRPQRTNYSQAAAVEVRCTRHLLGLNRFVAYFSSLVLLFVFFFVFLHVMEGGASTHAHCVAWVVWTSVALEPHGDS